MKLFKVAAIAAIVFSGSVLAGTVPQFGGGGGHNPGNGNNNGPNSELNIYQYGGGNSAVALQTDAKNSDLTITQHGGGNGADVGQGSDDNSIDLLQRGFGNSATLDQWNSKDSIMKVKQYGGGNGAAVDQTASNSQVNVTRGWLWQQRYCPSVLIHNLYYRKQGGSPVFSGVYNEHTLITGGTFQSNYV